MTRKHVVALAALLAVASAGGQARADTQAETHFQRGVELYSEADYRAALNEFRRAYEIEPRYQVLYNIALSDLQLLDYAGALQAFEKYLKDGRNEVSGSRRAEVDRNLQMLRGRVGKVYIVANVNGAEIAIDDAPAGTTPLSSPILVSAGRRKITVTAPGRTPSTSMVDLVGGDMKSLSVELVKPSITVAAPAPPPPPPPEPPPPPPRRVPWVGWVATGAFAAGAGVTGVLALNASSDLKSDLATLGVKQSTIDSAHGKTVALGIASDALLGAAAVAGGVSLYFTLRTPTADAQTSARAAIGPGNARVEVTF